MYLIAASVTTVVWAAVMAYGFWVQNPTGTFFRVFEVLRSSAWLIFLSVVVALVVRRDGRPAIRRWSSVALVVFCIVVLASELLPLIRISPAIIGESTDLRLLGSLGISIIGLALVENLYRNTHQDRRWEIKYLCLGIGAIFAYDFYLYSDSLLFDHLSYPMLEARGAPNALVVPLLAISAARNSEWSIDVFVSRRAVFHTTAFMGSGIYLLVMAAAAFYLREFGGQWGTALQVIALFSAAVLLLVVLFSGRFRAALEFSSASISSTISMITGRNGSVSFVRFRQPIGTRPCKFARSKPWLISLISQMADCGHAMNLADCLSSLRGTFLSRQE